MRTLTRSRAEAVLFSVRCPKTVIPSWGKFTIGLTAFPEPYIRSRSPLVRFISVSSGVSRRPRFIPAGANQVSAISAVLA